MAIHTAAYELDVTCQVLWLLAMKQRKKKALPWHGDSCLYFPAFRRNRASLRLAWATNKTHSEIRGIQNDRREALDLKRPERVDY